MKYQAVIFDLFGTLVENLTRQEYDDALSDMISIFGCPQDEFREIWMQTGPQRVIGTFHTLEENLAYICDGLNLSVTKKQIARASRVRRNYIARAMIPRKDAIEVISSLKSSGHKIGLVSNCSTEPPVIWRDTTFAPLFDAAVFSSVAGIRKPDPRIYQMATENLGVKPEDCLFIDDNANNLNAAGIIGMHAVQLLNPGENENTHAIEHQGDWQGQIITSLKEILTLVK